jgi:hypothetical protein
MKSASRAVVGLVAALSFTVANAEDVAPANAEVRYVVALADGASVATPLPTPESELDAYAGRYDAADGTAFVVYREGDSLTIELPQQFGSWSMRLYGTETRSAFTTEGSVRVVFDSDSSGRVLGLLFYASRDDVIAAGRAPAHRGIVTIHDLSADDVAARAPLGGFARTL